MLALTWPILVEYLLRTSFLSIDTLLLSNYSEEAVAAMSLVNNVGFFIQLLYSMVGIGASILISQNLGAKKTAEAGLVGVGSLVLICVFSAAASLGFALSARSIAGLFHLEPVVEACAVSFIRLYGGCSSLVALNIIQSNILRSWGHSRDPMYVNIGTLGLTIALSVFGLYGPFAFSISSVFATADGAAPLLANPMLAVDGVTWVAASTVLGQLAACIAFYVMIRKRKDIVLPLGEIRNIPGRIYRSILAIGVPSAGENMSYNVGQLVILSMISDMGTDALASYGILIAILRYVFISGVSIGMGTQIKVGYFVGAGMYDQAYVRVYRYFGAGFITSAVTVFVVYLFAGPLVSLFTTKAAILSITSAVLLVALIHEPGRNFNTIIIPALKGSGDVLFPVIAGMILMWGVGVFGAWYFGVHLGFGLVGIWIGMTLDEWVRGIVAVLRWRSRAWVKKSLVV